MLTVRTFRNGLLWGLLLTFTALLGFAQETRGPRHQPPAFTGVTPFNVVLGRPADTSMTLSLLSYSDNRTVVVRFSQDKALRSGQTRQSPPVDLIAAIPQEMALEGLQKATRYYYAVLDAGTQATLSNGTFVTQRQQGSAFGFTVTADSHLDQNTDPAIYQRTLANALADGPDFHIDLGDTFMTEKFADRSDAAQQYMAQRYYFGTVANALPIFLALGNHDGEEARQLRDGAQSLGVWANGMRKQYFPNPVPDRFYAGNPVPDPRAGHLQDYYAWTWGDALFVVLNPYWYAAPRRTEERWGLSLGDVQYAWLRHTLETSTAKYKLVFIHQLAGGLNSQGRGGVEAAGFGEWGGRNADGSEGLRTHRPGWPESIHAMLVRNQVSMVFHGHDHLYAKQDLDGIVYQEVPQPGHAGPGNNIGALMGGYKEGVIMGNSGHMHVTVTPEFIQADFKAVELANAGNAAPGNRKILHSYRVLPVLKASREK